MKDPLFDVTELRCFLEEKWGKFKRFEMVLLASRPENFKVESLSGELFLVKCVPHVKNGLSTFQKMFIPHLQELENFPIAIHLKYGIVEWKKFTIVALSWCPGIRIMPDRLSSANRKELIRAYHEFSMAIQKTKICFPMRDSAKEREIAIKCLSSFGCGTLRSFLENEIPKKTLRLDDKNVKVIHGDLHHGNFHFKDDKVSGFMDFEEFRFGYPTEDLIRYLLVGAEHLHWFDFAGRRRIFDFLKELLPLYSREEWLLALNAFYVRKIFRRFSKKRSTLNKIFLSHKMRFRLTFYFKLRRLILT